MTCHQPFSRSIQSAPPMLVNQRHRRVAALLPGGGCGGAPRQHFFYFLSRRCTLHGVSASGTPWTSPPTGHSQGRQGVWTFHQTTQGGRDVRLRAPMHRRAGNIGGHRMGRKWIVKRLE